MGHSLRTSGLNQEQSSPHRVTSVTPKFIWNLDVAGPLPTPPPRALPASTSVFTVSGSLLQNRRRKWKKRLEAGLTLRRPTLKVRLRPGVRVRGALSWSSGWREPQSHSYSSKKSTWTELCSLGGHSSCRGSALGRPVSKRWPRAPLVPSGLGPRAGADRQFRTPDPHRAHLAEDLLQGGSWQGFELGTRTFTDFSRSV